MQILLHNKGLYRVTMGREVKLQQPLDNSKHLNKLDEAFGFMCIHISRELLFHLDGLRTPKSVWDNLKSLFGKQDDVRDYILENEPNALHPNNFETIQHFFSKFEYLEKSSMNVKKYLEFPQEGVVGGPIRYEWIKSSNWMTFLYFPFSYLCYACFPTMHPLHVPLENLMLGSPSTMFSLLKA